MIDVLLIKDEINNNYLSLYKTVRVYPAASGNNTGDGNNLLHTGFYYALLEENGALTDLDKDVAREIIDSHRHFSTPQLWRSPIKTNKDDNQNHDDYWGALFLGKVGHFVWSSDFLAYNRKTGWIDDIQEPQRKSFRYWLGRFSEFVACVYAAAGLEVPFLEKVRCAVGIAFGKVDGDSYLKFKCKQMILRNESSIIDAAIKIYRYRVTRAGGGRKLTAEYFGAEHSICKFEFRE